MKMKAFTNGAVAAMALMAIGASGASATTLEVGGVTQNKAVTIEASASSAFVLAKTDGSEANTCSEASLKTTTGFPYTGHTVTAVTSNLEYKVCTRFFTIHKAGRVHLTFTSATRAIVSFSQTEWTVGSSFGFNVTCSTGEGTNVGTLTGVASGSATIHINAVLNCGFLLPSATFKGTYKVSSPSGLGAVA